ncbi:sodium:proton antiporter NhaD [Paraneptunicella aestuarii]|uniref:sodium:proton antiporter NhaD n=1 Tax=Paraneptunicella aestuarii TaxID=2831148 RepID=UPI001E4CF224|nr:sodium:proton antiporter NhaD [Paraneptunicella aestuarii]UAA38617.1 sodium:proton antiporter NhaD [Paraneptunicella aestuarii]
MTMFNGNGTVAEFSEITALLTHHWVGYACLAIFFVGYVLVILEERLKLRKSKPMLLAAALIWVLIGIFFSAHGATELVEVGMRHSFLEYAELFFFLLVTMTYINAMMERGVFHALRLWLIAHDYTYRQLFWITGLLAFFLSPVADNLTTALILCAVVMAVSDGRSKFVLISCINIVVAANAGGAFSPFGDITTLMIWQKGMVSFWDFFQLFLPAVVNFMIPALIMQYAIPNSIPPEHGLPHKQIKFGGRLIVLLFAATITTAVTFHSMLGIPPVFGMLTGLAYLKLYGYVLRQRSRAWVHKADNPPGSVDDPYDFDVFAKVAHAEWDTLFFFYGVIMAVGGLGFIGYLGLASEMIYGQFGLTIANSLVGIVSAVVDNIPVVYAILTMQPDMPEYQWLLVTLSAGVGGSLLSIGSAAGVALMGQARGQYTFWGHLKWTPVIALGYVASILVHLGLNG